MARIAVIGDGPAGLSAALFLAKADHETDVYGDDSSLVEYAELHNWLGSPGISGAEFQDAARAQVEEIGATFWRDLVATALRPADGAVTVVTPAGDETYDYVVVAGGKSTVALVADAGGIVDGGAVVVDGDARTTVDRVYAAGHLVRPERSQAIISAGMGAVAALDILAREAGDDVHDWDSPSE